MFENIISGDVSKSVLTGKVIGSKFNALMIKVDDVADTPELTSISDLDDIQLEVIYKNRRKDIFASRNMRLSDIFKLSNAMGGYAIDLDNETTHYALMPFGLIDVKNSEVLEASIQNGSELTDLEIDVDTVFNNDMAQNTIIGYESSEGGSTESFKSAMNIFATEEFTGTASINDNRKSYSITYDKAKGFANTEYDLEKKITLGELWQDSNKRGQTVNAYLPTGQFVVIRRY